MGLTERLAYILSVDYSQGEAGFGRYAASADKAALAEAKVTIAAAKVEVAQARAAQTSAKAAGDSDKLAAADTRLAAAQLKLSASKNEASVLGAKGELAAAEQGLNGIAGKSGMAGKALGFLQTQSGAAGQSLAGLAGAPAAGPAAVGVAAVAAGVVTAKAISSVVHSYLDLNDQVRQYKSRSGDSAETASRMVAVFHGLGISVDDASTAAFKLNRNIDANQAKLASFGVTIARNADGTTNYNQTLLNIVSTYQHTADSSQRAGLMNAAFGKGAQALVPLLTTPIDKIKELGDAAARRGEIFTNKDNAQAKEFEVQLRELGEDAKALEIELGKRIVPALAAVVTNVDKLVQGVDAIGHKIEHLPGGEHLVKALTAIPLMATPIGPMLAGIDDGSKKAAASQAQLAIDAASVVDPVDAESTAIDDATKSLESMTSALSSERSAKQSITAAEKAVADAREESAKKARDEAAATDQMHRADVGLARAERDLAAAKREMPENRAKAELDEETATWALVDAKRAETVAVEKYGQTSEEASKAVIGRKEAEFGLSDATAKRKGLETDRPQSIVDAEQKVADAKKAQADAAVAKTAADKEDPVADLAKAERDLADKTDAEYLTRLKLAATLKDFNSQFGQTLSLADVLNGKADDLLTKLLASQTALASLNADQQLAAAQASGAGGIGIAGAGIPAAAPAPAPAQTVITVGPVYNNNPDEIGKKVAFAFRAR